MEEVARAGLPHWMDQTFWAAEVDPILLSGIQNASQCQCEAVEIVLHAFPQLHVDMIWDRLRRLRKRRTKDLHAVVPAFAVANDCNARVMSAEGQADSSATAQAGRMTVPSRMDRGFWRTEVDPVLVNGIRNANQLERETIDRVCADFPNCGSAQFGRAFDAYRNNERETDTQARRFDGQMNWMSD